MFELLGESFVCDAVSGLGRWGGLRFSFKLIIHSCLTMG